MARRKDQTGSVRYYYRRFGPSFLERRDKSPSVTINAQTVGIPTGTVAQQWEAKFSQLKDLQELTMYGVVIWKTKVKVSVH